MHSVTAPAVEFDAITTVRGSDAVFDGLRLRLEPGRITVLMGESGSGKTTLVRHLVGLLAPTVGAVRINGRDIWAMDPAELRQARGQMSAVVGGTTFESSLFASLSVYDNVAYGPRLCEAHDRRVHSAIMPVVRAFGLQDIAEQPVDQLSARTKRRVVLARALVARAELLVLDDIEAGFDSRYTEKILDVIDARKSRHDSTLLVTTHDPNLAQLLADRVAVLGNGKIIAHGPPGVLLDGILSAADFHRRFGFGGGMSKR